MVDDALATGTEAEDICSANNVLCRWPSHCPVHNCVWDQRSLNKVIHLRADGAEEPRGFGLHSNGHPIRKPQGLDHARLPDDPMIFSIPLAQPADGEPADCHSRFEPGDESGRGAGCPGCSSSAAAATAANRNTADRIS